MAKLAISKPAKSTTSIETLERTQKYSSRTLSTQQCELISMNSVEHVRKRRQAKGRSADQLASADGEELHSINLEPRLPHRASAAVTTEVLSRERVIYDEKISTSRTPRRLIRPTPAKSNVIMTDEEESLISSENSSQHSMSDFIVNDSASEDELRKPPPSMRKKKPVATLLRSPRNRRYMVLDDDEDGSEFKEPPMSNSLTSKLKELDLNTVRFKPTKKSIPRGISKSEIEQSMEKSPAKYGSRVQDDPKSLNLHTPPTSPSKPKLQSPSKSRIIIPQSPHRQSIDTFWTQETINEWNDVYSPQKTQKIKKFFYVQNDHSDLSPSESPKRSPMRSPIKRDKAVIEKRRAFELRKQSLATEFLEELDRMITDSKLATLSESTGGVKIVWSRTLNSTAGRAKWQREAVRTTEVIRGIATTTTTYNHNASIELAEKVIDDEDRLLNVLAHEFCHLANFMISNVKDQPHGKSFREWAAKVTAKFPHKNINVTTKHSYTIDYKYIWGCIDCGVEYKRHSKSIDPVRHTCSECKGKLVQTKPVPRGRQKNAAGTTKSSTGNPYHLFVKQWYGLVKDEHPGWKMKEIMSELARRYKVEKESALPKTQLKLDEEPDLVVIDELDATPNVEEDGRSPRKTLFSNKLEQQMSALTL